MNHGYSEVLGTIPSLRAASDNLRMIDDMITGIAHTDYATTERMTGAEKVQAHLGLIHTLADMVVARHAYSSNQRVLATTDAMLDLLY